MEGAVFNIALHLEGIHSNVLAMVCKDWNCAHGSVMKDFGYWKQKIEILSGKVLCQIHALTTKEWESTYLTLYSNRLRSSIPRFLPASCATLLLEVLGQECLSSIVHRAIEEDNVDTVAKYISQAELASYRIVFHAAHHGSLRVLNFLLKKSLDPNLCTMEVMINGVQTTRNRSFIIPILRSSYFLGRARFLKHLLQDSRFTEQTLKTAVTHLVASTRYYAGNLQADFTKLLGTLLLDRRLLDPHVVLYNQIPIVIEAKKPELTSAFKLLLTDPKYYRIAGKGSDFELLKHFE